MPGNAYHWFLTDHLGSVRVVASASGAAEEYDYYYPLGGPIAQYSSASSLQPLKFQGKEWSTAKSMNLYDFGARRYDPASGRWLSQDPLAEKYYAHSPYLFCAANPMTIVDPTGLSWYTINENGEIEMINIAENESFDRLFLSIPGNVGPPDLTNYIIIKDQSILKDRRDLKSIPSSASKKDVLNIFYFASDSYTDREWGMYENKSSYSLITNGCHDHVSSPLENTIWKIHSHSDTISNDREELESMGYWFYHDSDFKDGRLINKDAIWYEAPRIPNDHYNQMIMDIPSRVYFPLSGHVYKINVNKLPTLEKTRKRNKR